MKVTRYILLSVTIILALVPVSCTPVEPVIEFPDANSVVITADGGSQTVSFTTNYDWEATVSDSWIQISPAAGKKGNTTITITIGANGSDQERKGSVTINSQALRRSIAVTQAANYMQAIFITHENASFSPPVFTGIAIKGKIEWGDGTEDYYAPGYNHSYSSAGSHTVTIKMNGGTGFDIESLSGITEIDVSNF
ncbi:MAG: BACON domain-containing protein [Bacteroidales bacterium]|nr:BACON domain-containing protein [Bacteroidales bacterium]